MESLQFSKLRKRAGKGIVVGFEQIRPMDAAVKRNRVADGMLHHRLT